MTNRRTANDETEQQIHCSKSLYNGHEISGQMHDANRLPIHCRTFATTELINA